MRRLTTLEAEFYANNFRAKNGIGLDEPISAKILLRKLNITTIYRRLSEDSYGISCKSKSGKMFMMINSNTSRGCQHFTIAHELFHLFYEESPTPHMCNGTAVGVEKDANLFASALLMPRNGIMALISIDEVHKKRVELPTILRLEQMFGVSRMALLLRLKDIGFLREEDIATFSQGVKESAKAYGYDLSLYETGNEGLFIGDFGEKARTLFEQGSISEGHYNELINMISNARGED